MKLKHALLTVSIATAASFSAMLPAAARPAVLIGQTPGSQVNVRSGPSIQANTPSYDLVGDRVQVLRAIVNEGNAWYSVKFPSGAQGWIRGDLAQPLDVGGC